MKNILKTTTKKSIVIIVIVTFVFVLLSELLCLFKYGGKSKDSLITVASDILLISLNDYSSAQAWLKTEEENSDNGVWKLEYAYKTIFTTHFYLEDGSKWKIPDNAPIKKMALQSVLYAEEPVSVLYTVSPFIKVYDVAIIAGFAFCEESAVYYSTNKGEYIYFCERSDPNKHYLFSIEEANKISKFFEDNNSTVHVDGGKSWPLVREYEGIEEFEIEPLNFVYYIKAILCFLLLSSIVFIMVALIEKKRTKTKMEE